MMQVVIPSSGPLKLPFFLVEFTFYIADYSCKLSNHTEPRLHFIKQMIFIIQLRNLFIVFKKKSKCMSLSVKQKKYI